ncbi:MAG: glycosyltransferase [Acidobacteriota bacterium]|nr:glycosyltransferase [Acidobacteriota bacterium]
MTHSLHVTAVQDAVDTDAGSGVAVRSTPGKIKVVHVINSLGIGGAELALFRLMTNADRAAFDMQVIALVHESPLGERLREAGFRVHCLSLSKKRVDASAMLRLVRLLRKEKPDIVQTWLQHSDLLGGIAAKFAGVGPVLWNIRHSTLHPVLTKRRTRLVTQLCARLSAYIPAKIICCSESSREEQVKIGYAARKMVVISNGVNTSRFKPDPEAYRLIRNEIGIPLDALLFGAAGRFHPAKDHVNLIRAAGEIARQNTNAHFVFCGERVDMENPELKAWVLETGFADRFHLLGRRDDVQRVMAALDVFISSSGFSEGFPNVVCEAMSCGVPCVVTDVGDSARIVGDTGRVVPPEQPSAIAKAALEFCSSGTNLLRKSGLEAQRRISGHFGISRMVSRYQEIYSETVARERQ